MKGLYPMTQADSVHSTSPTNTSAKQPLFEEDDSPDLPVHILYDDDTTATPIEALCYVLGRAVEDLMNAAAGKAVQS
jgi:hypothetical protein